jgi:cell wall-associated NlpC family hydrolase
MVTIHDILPTIIRQRGDRYVFGAEASFSNPDPDRFDCSELLEWAIRGRHGVPFPDGSAAQYQHCRNHGTAMQPAEAFRTFGALIFRLNTGAVNHVAVSLGDGRTFEARGSAYGVNYFEVANRQWTHAARIPGVAYSVASIPQPGGDMTEAEKTLMFEVLARLDNKGTEANNRLADVQRKVELIKAKVGA